MKIEFEIDRNEKTMVLFVPRKEMIELAKICVKKNMNTDRASQIFANKVGSILQKIGNCIGEDLLNYQTTIEQV
jgi:hypothetical protein